MDEYEQWDIVSGVGVTALLVAAARAAESARPDRLIDDPYAAAFVKAAAPMLPPAIREQQWFHTLDSIHSSDGIHDRMVTTHANYLGLRSRLLDDYLSRAALDGIGQVVIMAAGLDTRGYRLSWPAGLRLFEIDQPNVLAFKDQVLRDNGAQPRCERTTVPVDLRDDWPSRLVSAGFRPEAPTVWLIEGLLPYLPPDAEQRLFAAINELSASGSRLACEQSLSIAALTQSDEYLRIRNRVGINIEQLFNTEPRPRPATWLTSVGWIVAEESAATASRRYERDLLPAGAVDAGSWLAGIGEHTSFLTAQRRALMPQPVG